MCVWVCITYVCMHTCINIFYKQRRARYLKHLADLYVADDVALYTTWSHFLFFNLKNLFLTFKWKLRQKQIVKQILIGNRNHCVQFPQFPDQIYNLVRILSFEYLSYLFCWKWYIFSSHNIHLRNNDLSDTQFVY